MSTDPVVVDVVIVGAGAAGLYTALCLPAGLSVTIVDKATASDGGSSPWAQGGLAAAMGDDDSADMHVRDTIAAGDGLTDPVAARVLADETPAHVERLVELGARFDRDASGALSLAREGAQSTARSVRRADATGAELLRVLRAAVVERVTRLVGTASVLRADAGGRVVGVDVRTGRGNVTLAARAIVLATGGCGGLWAATTNPVSATGDGMSLASTAGAAIRDAEFVQFHPTALATEGHRGFLLTEALRGAGATLHDADGARFMPDVHPDAELAPRHVVSHAILERSAAVAWLDATMIGRDRLVEEFPNVFAGVAAEGFDLATQRVPVSPAAHYHVGGVRTDLHGHTSIDGLYACGEVASTGVHGANRMGGNSLAEALVFGARVATAVQGSGLGRRAPASSTPTHTALPSSSPDPGRDVLAALREAMLRDAGPMRTGERLGALLARIDGWHAGTSADQIEQQHALVASRLIVRGALLRTESRGGHQRTDHPGSSDAWDGVHLEQAVTDVS